MTTAPRNAPSGGRDDGAGGPVGPLAGAAPRAALALTLVPAAVAAGLAAVTTGGAGAAGVLVGTAVVLGFFALGAVVIGAVARVAPAASLLVALLTYTLQVVLVAAVFAGLQRSGALGSSVDARWLAGTVVVGTFCWVAGLVLASLRERVPAFDVPPPGPVDETPDDTRDETRDDGSGDGGGTVSQGREAGAR